MAAIAHGTDVHGIASHGRGEPLRAHIVEVAGNLFARDGVRAVGVNRVTTEAAISKKTLYKYFPSKDELVVAYLDMRDQPVRDAIAAAALSAGEDPRNQLLGIFNHLAREAEREDYSGCIFAKTISELPKDHPARVRACEHKEQLRAFLQGIATEAGASAPNALAARLLLLYDGAAAAASIHASPVPVHDARAAAADLIALSTE
jgi:AcrR family transcriptional regulator